MNIHEHFLEGLCDKCPYLDLKVTDECLWSDDEIYTRHISVTCSNAKACARASRIGVDSVVDIMKGDKA